MSGLATFVLRLVRDRLDTDELVGRVESVEDGEAQSFTSAHELIAYLTAETLADRAEEHARNG